MRSVIYKTAVLPASPDALFNMYVDPSSHEAITGLPAVIDEQSGTQFAAFDGALTGIILETARPRLIVQTWRSPAFKPDDPDSTLIIAFNPEGAHGRIDLVHLDVPDHDYEGVKHGWDEKYFEPWRAYLKTR
jgi:activator of HSP90 ATPase